MLIGIAETEEPNRLHLLSDFDMNTLYAEEVKILASPT